MVENESLKHLVLILACSLVVALVLPRSLAPDEAYACEVAGQRPLQDAYDNSITIFSGKVVGIQKFTVGDYGDYDLVSFEVHRYWKAAEEKDYDHQIIFTSGDGNTCGYEFEAGRTYLVYAIHWWHDPDALFTGLGYRNQPLETAQEDLLFLGEGKVPTRQLGLDEQMRGIDIRPLPKPHEEAKTTVLSIVGIGAAAAGVAAYFSLRKLR